MTQTSKFTSSRPLRAVFDSAAFKSNIEHVECLAPKSRAMIVLKANAYGHGLLEMARLAGGRDLAVAIPSECEELVTEGVNNSIWVLEGPFGLDCLKLSERADIIWVLHSDWQLELLESYFRLNGDRACRLKVCLKLNTGMNRLGFGLGGLSKAFLRTRAMKSLEIVALMTHFSCSDTPDDVRVMEQADLFEREIESAGLSHLPRTLSNSGGVLFYPSMHADVVRPGIMLYGGMPSNKYAASDYQLKPVMRLRSAIIAIQDVDPGESVGYGNCWTATRRSRIAVVAVGYGDGYPRHAANGTPVALFDGSGVGDERAVHIVPLVGRVSMDMITIDVTDVDTVSVGDEVELWGSHVSADLVARNAETISYELFCNISERVPREYI